MSQTIVPKPKGYKSHFIVDNPKPKLIINLDYTIFQAQMDLGEEGQEYEVVESDDNLIITEKVD